MGALRGDEIDSKASNMDITPQSNEETTATSNSENNNADASGQPPQKRQRVDWY